MSEIFFSPGPVHGCLQCGSSCYHTAIGPISEKEIERIEASSIAETMSDIPNEVWYHVEDANSGTTYRFLKTRKAHCIFLTDDKQCGLHRHLGVSFKPLVCRTFPMVLTKTPRGLFASNSIECRQALAALKQPHEEAAEEIREIWKDGPPAHYEIGDQVHVSMDKTVDYASYEKLEGELMALIGDKALDYDQRLLNVVKHLRSEVSITTEPLADTAYRALMRALCISLATLARKNSGVDKEPLYSSRWVQLSEAAHSLVNWINVPRVELDDSSTLLLQRQFENLLFGKMMITKSVLSDGVAIARFNQFLVRGLAAYRVAQAYRYALTDRDTNDAILLVEFVGRTVPMVQFLTSHIETIRLLFLDPTERWDSR